jgi:hypothetical protein
VDPQLERPAGGRTAVRRRVLFENRFKSHAALISPSLGMAH